MNRIAGVTVLLFALGVLVYMYGNARYATGVADSERRHVESVALVAKNTKTEIEKNIVKSNNLSESDIDRELVELGIMREHR